MQSIDQQAAASQTSGQPLSRNSSIQTPNSCMAGFLRFAGCSLLTLPGRR
jgi:hypothetical protein